MAARGARAAAGDAGGGVPPPGIMGRIEIPQRSSAPPQSDARVQMSIAAFKARAS